MTRLPGNHLVTVCDVCFCASCWHGLLYCSDYQNAGVIRKTVDDLDALKKENPDYYSREAILKTCGPSSLPKDDPEYIKFMPALYQPRKR